MRPGWEPRKEKALSRAHVSMGLAFPGTRKGAAPLEARNKRKQPLEWPPEGGMSLAPRCSFSTYDTVPSVPCWVHFSTGPWTQMQGQLLPRSHLCHVLWAGHRTTDTLLVLGDSVRVGTFILVRRKPWSLLWGSAKRLMSSEGSWATTQGPGATL